MKVEQVYRINFYLRRGDRVSGDEGMNGISHFPGSYINLVPGAQLAKGIYGFKISLFIVERSLLQISVLVQWPEVYKWRVLLAGFVSLGKYDIIVHLH